MQTYVIADDLSGAAETAAAMAAPDASGRLRRRVSLVLGIRPVHDQTADIVVVDTGSRGVGAETAHARMREALAAAPNGALRFVKTDSLLRGNLGTELDAARVIAPIVFAPALPSLARTTVHGVPLVGGVPLAQTDAWAAESRSAPSMVTGAFPCGSAEVVPLDAVRSPGFASAVADVVARGRIACCDAQSAQDLARIAQVAIEHGALLAGSSDLAAALARTSSSEHGGGAVAPRARQVSTVHLIGTASKSIEAQAERLAESGVTVMRPTASQLESLVMPDGDAAVIVRDRIDAALAPRIVDGMRRLATQLDGRNVVLAGGETARAVLDALGVRTLRPVAVPHTGAVVSLTDDGRVVATRPGSFGDARSLADLHDTVAALVRGDDTANHHDRKVVS